ncbi:MAG: hypothetical protein Q7S19_00200 [bacterium]|nr:hypothetical protein [bacterium]
MTANPALSQTIKNGEIIITGNEPELRAKVPQWIKDFRKEVKKYDLDPKQPSLNVLRQTGRGNCEAFAKLGALYAIHSGYSCEFVIIANGNDGHIFLYVRCGDDYWSISNRVYYHVGSIDDAKCQMGAVGHRFIMKIPATLSGLNWEYRDLVYNNSAILQDPLK